MTAITITLDDAALRHTLDKLSAHIENMDAVMDDIGAAMVQNILLNLGDGKQYDGMPMAPLKRPRRRQGRGRFGDTPLNDTRQHIYNKITHTFDAHSVAIGMNEEVNIGALHQFGGQAGRGRKTTIPARPFLPIKNNAVDLPAAWTQEIHDIIKNALTAVT
jgi:phage virion morphogenesis protein